MSPWLQYAAGLVGYVHRQLEPADCVDRAAGPHHGGVREGGALLRRRQPRAMGRLREGPTQGRRDARTSGPVHRHRGRAVRRPRSVTTSTATRIRGSCPRPGWSTTSISIASTRTSARASSSSAPTSLTTASCGFNGHEWARRQAARAGIGFEALDTVVVVVVAAVQASCDHLGPDNRHRHLTAVTAAHTTVTGARVPGLRLVDQRSHALLSGAHTHRYQVTDRGLGTVKISHLRPRPRPLPGPGRTRRTHPNTRKTQSSRHRLPQHRRQAHHHSIIRPPSSGTSAQLANLTQNSGFAGAVHRLPRAASTGAVPESVRCRGRRSLTGVA